jgi:DNA polymerase-3 subunit beta
MKLSILQENLLKALSLAGRCVSAKQTLPVLSNILLATEEGRLRICATNLETSLTLWVGAKVEEEGAITVPARVLTDFVSSLPNEKVSLSVNEENLSISCRGYLANLAGIAASEYPPVPRLNEETTFSIDPKIFAKAIGQVAFTASTDEGRAVLTGVYLEPEEKNLNLVSTDGYRLARKTFDCPAQLGEGLVLPARSALELVKVAGEADEEEPLKIAVTKSKNQAIFALGNVQLATRLIDGTFPNYRQILPKGFQTRLLIGVEELAKAVRVAAVFARDLGSVVKLGLDPGSKKVTLSSSTAQVGEGECSFEASIEGEPVKAAFNSRYLIDALNALNSTQVSLELNGQTSPMLLKPVGDSSYLHVIMPVRLQNNQ